MQIDKAHRYIEAIRKPAKRAYAEHYWNWLVDSICTKSNKPKPQPSCLSVMAAQAVRMNLDAFTR